MTDQPTARADRHGPLQPGDLVQLTDPKGRHHTFALVPGKEFHTHKGKIDHDDLIGRPEGIVVTTVAGVPTSCCGPCCATSCCRCRGAPR